MTFFYDFSEMEQLQAAELLLQQDLHWGVYADALHRFLSKGRPYRPDDRHGVSLSVDARKQLRDLTQKKQETLRNSLAMSGLSEHLGQDSSLIKPMEWGDTHLHRLLRAHELYYSLMPECLQFLRAKSRGRDSRQPNDLLNERMGWCQSKGETFPFLSALHSMRPHIIQRQLGLHSQTHDLDLERVKASQRLYPIQPLLELGVLICDASDAFTEFKKTADFDHNDGHFLYPLFQAVMSVLDAWIKGLPTGAELKRVESLFSSMRLKRGPGGKGREAGRITTVWRTVLTANLRRGDDLEFSRLEHLAFVVDDLAFESGNEALHPHATHWIRNDVLKDFSTGRALDLDLPPHRILSRFHIHGVSKRDVKNGFAGFSDALDYLTLGRRDPRKFYLDSLNLQELLYVSDRRQLAEPLKSLAPARFEVDQSEALYETQGRDECLRGFITWVLVVKESRGWQDKMFDAIQRAMFCDLAHRYVVFELAPSGKTEWSDERLADISRRLEDWEPGSSDRLCYKRVVYVERSEALARGEGSSPIPPCRVEVVRPGLVNLQATRASVVYEYMALHGESA